jgi:hypothetical protein
MTWGSGGVAPPFLISARDGGDWLFSLRARFTPGDRAPVTHLIGCVRTVAGLDALEKNLAPAEDGTLTVEPVVSRYTNWTISAFTLYEQFILSHIWWWL